MKIIGIDNLNNETVSDYLYLDNIKWYEKKLAERICNKMNEHLGDHAGRYYKLVSQNYKLYKYEY